ncbi:unnamed protein product [Rotaria sp. Silwood1]|nr:unnamed protein product [Rotaria sp. Silwood1]CAF1662171.1 unnamed protein product [Rotaria sp. Silwood1]
MILETGNNSRPQSLVISDFNNDGLMDIGLVNSRAHNIGIFLGYGDISFGNQITYSTYPYLYPCSMAVGDFNNDTRVDIVFASCESDSVGIVLGYENGSFGNQMMYPTRSNSSGYSLAAEDINNDTILDIVVANHDTNYLGVLLGQGNGTFASNYGTNEHITMAQTVIFWYKRPRNYGMGDHIATMVQTTIPVTMAQMTI